MADEKKTYLINIESNLKKYAEEAAEAKKKVDELKVANENLKKTGTAAEIEASSAALKVANQEYSKAQKMVQLQIAANSSETGSRKQLGEILNLQMQALGKLGDAYITAANGQRELNPLYIEQRKRIEETKKAIIDYDLALNDGRSNVGRYGESVSIAMKEAGKNIASLFPSLRPVISGIESVQRSIKATGTTATTTFKSIKVAIASTGIGLLVIAVTALIALFAKLGIGKILMDKLTDAIGLTTNAQDKLAEAQTKSNEASIAGLNNELALLKARGVSMDEIFQKELALAKARFETEKATLLAYANSKKNFKLAAEGGEQDLKLQEAKTAYFVLLASQNKSTYDRGVKNMDDLALLKEKDLAKDLLAIEQWYTAESAKYPMDYSLSLLYIEKKKQARLKDAERIAKENEDAFQKNLKSKELMEQYTNEYFDKEKKRTEELITLKLLQAKGDPEKMKAALKFQYEEDLKLMKDNQTQKKILEITYNEAIALIDKEAKDKKDALIKTDQEAGFELQRLKAKEDIDLLQKVLDDEYWAAIQSIEYAKMSKNQKLVIDQKYNDASAALAKEGLGRIRTNAENEKLVIADALGAISDIIGKQTVAGKVLAIAQATINTWVAASQALRDPTLPSVIMKVAAMVAIIGAGLMTVANIVKVKVPGGGGGSTPSMPTAISSSAPAQRTFAQSAGSTILTQPQLSQTQLNALPQQGLLTAADIAAALSKMPPPVVTVEDINAKTAEVKKVSVRATI